MVVLSEDETKECSTMTNTFIISIIFSALIFFATLLSACINQHLGESDVFFALRVMSTAVSASLLLAIWYEGGVIALQLEVMAMRKNILNGGESKRWKLGIHRDVILRYR